ncbi:MAG: Mpo1-like protein [Burkholderiaceae bacterium]
MRTLTDQLANYAAYHRDRRNIATHFIGVPMIVLAVTVLLSRPSFSLGALTLNPAWIVALLAALFYLRLSLGLGAVMSALLAVAVAVAAPVAAQSTDVWLSWGIGLFLLGWVIQFVGHWYEGRKPAFVDDLIGLLIGPLFVVAEFAFLLGFAHELKRDIEARVGSARIGPAGGLTP